MHTEDCHDVIAREGPVLVCLVEWPTRSSNCLSVCRLSVACYLHWLLSVSHVLVIQKHMYLWLRVDQSLLRVGRQIQPPHALALQDGTTLLGWPSKVRRSFPLGKADRPARHGAIHPGAILFTPLGFERLVCVCVCVCACVCVWGGRGRLLR